MKKKRTGSQKPPRFTAGLRQFNTRDKVFWEAEGVERRFRNGLVICQHFKSGAVRVQDQFNGAELWLENNQPTPGWHPEARLCN